MLKFASIGLRVASALMIPVALFGAFGAYLAGDIFACGLCGFFAAKMVVFTVVGF